MSRKVKKEKKISPLKGSNLWGLLLFGILLLVDMLTKLFADAYFSQPSAPKQVDIIPGWISLRIAYNKGIAYGMGSNSPTWAKIAVVVVTGLLMVGLSILYFKLDKRRSWMRMALVFVIAGGVGNFIDRVYYQVWDVNAAYGVRDMVDLSRFGFAVCNFADFFISGGAVALVLSLLFFDKEALFPVGKYKALAQEGQEVEVENEAEIKTTQAEEKTTEEIDG